MSNLVIYVKHLCASMSQREQIEYSEQSCSYLVTYMPIVLMT